MAKLTVPEALDWLKRFDRFHIRPGLERMETMLKALGRPERGLRFLHIAGTNGKGSTGAFTTQLLRELDYNVGMFSSPAIMHELDRIQYNGNRIADDDFLKCAMRVRRVISALEDVPTEFEVITVIALVYFNMIRPDWVVWETGLGGRWDSTNIVEPCVSVITNVGYDHTAILGETEAEIASEKAGIIKVGRPVVTAAENTAEAIIRKRAEDRHCPYYRLQDVVRTPIQEKRESEQSFSYTGLHHRWENLTIQLPGRYQVNNAALSLLTLEVLERQQLLTLRADVIRQGLRKTRWPGRMELISGRPRILLDAAHNPEAAVQLADAISIYFTYHAVCLIIGIFTDKDVEAVVHPLARLASNIIVTSGTNPRYIPAEQLAEMIRGTQSNVAVTVAPNPQAAVKLARHKCRADDLIVVAGSHDLMSAVRKVVYRAIDD